MTDSKKKRTRKSFSDEFKREAVELSQGVGVSAKQVSADPGKSTCLLYRWVSDARDDPPEADQPKYKELQKELRRTHRELDFFKKGRATSRINGRTVSIARPMASVLSCA
ncbi:MAG: transposase [Gammaproteobacteria bacterium]|nr:transposase [Gammaproteobacteria bacterium]